MKRALTINFRDGTSKELVLSKATRIKSEGVDMMHLDKLPDESWRLIFSDSITDDFSKIESFSIVRED